MWIFSLLLLLFFLFVCVAVDTFEHCLLGLQSLCFGLGFGRGRSFLLCFGAILVKTLGE